MYHCALYNPCDIIFTYSLSNVDRNMARKEDDIATKSAEIQSAIDVKYSELEALEVEIALETEQVANLESQLAELEGKLQHFLFDKSTSESMSLSTEVADESDDILVKSRLSEISTVKAELEEKKKAIAVMESAVKVKDDELDILEDIKNDICQDVDTIGLLPIN
jgi:chromosome segregation ATPase